MLGFYIDKNRQYDMNYCDKIIIMKIIDYLYYYFFLLAQGQGQRPWLGMEHPNKSKRTRLNYLEKAIKIYN